MSSMPCHPRNARSSALALGTVLLLLQAPPAPAQSPVPDFSRGFLQFQGLGLSDVTNATYVRLGQDAAMTMGSRYMHRGETAIPGSDGAWLVKRISDDEAEILTSAQQRIILVSPRKWKVEWQEKIAATQQAAMSGDLDMEMNPYDQIGQADTRRIPGSWTEADPVADGRALIAYVEKLAPPGNEDDYDENPLQTTAGEMLLSAANLHRRGAAAEANRLAQLLFEKGGGQQTVIEQAVSLLADAQYADLYQAFMRTRDWEAYRTGMTALTTRFARGWQRRDAVLRVVPAIESRAAGPAPVPAGDGLGEEDLALAAALAAPRQGASTATPALHEYSIELWILPPLEAPTDKPADAIAQIKRRGLQAIPLLLALLSDTYPTEYDNPAGSIPMRNDSFQSWSSGPVPPQMAARMAKQRADAYYVSLPRPLTRGEIANVLLRQVVPLPEELRYNRHSGTAADPVQLLRTAAESWYAANKDLSTADIALGYLRAEDGDGNNPHQMASLRYLTQQGGETAFAEIERVLLAMEPMQASGMAMEYAQQRGDAARPFITAFITRLKPSEVPLQDGGDGLFVQPGSGSRGGNEEWSQRMIKQFEAMLVNEPLETLLAGVNAGNSQFSIQYPILAKAAAKETPERATGLLLAAAVNATNVQTTSQLIGLVSSLPYSRMTGRNRRARAEAPPPEMPAPSVHRDLWSKLLDDERPVPSHNQMTGTTTLGEQTAWILERFNADVSAQMHEMESMQLYTMLPKDQITALLLRRARLRIEGEPTDKLPPLPSADNITADARKALVADLIATTPEALSGRIAALSLDEQLAMIKELGQNQPLREALRPLANRIQRVEIKVDDPAIQSSLQALAQQPVSKAVAEQLFAAVQSIATNGQTSVIGMLVRQAPGDGITLSLRTAGKDDGGMLNMYSYGMHGQRSAPAITGMYSVGDVNGFGRWKVQLPKPAASEDTPASPQAARKLKIMEIIKTGMENLTPELIAELAALGGDDIDNNDMDEGRDAYARNNDEFWKQIETIGEAGTYAEPLFLTFTFVLPKDTATGEESGEEFMIDGIMEY